MRIVDSMWSPACTILSVVCDCDKALFHETASLVITCPHCGTQACWSADHAAWLKKPLAVDESLYAKGAA